MSRLLNDIKVNKDLIIWARGHRNVSHNAIAKKIDVSPEEYSRIEETGIISSFAMFEALADKLKFPTAAFFLPAPPKEKGKVGDFRLSTEANHEWSFEFTRVLDQVDEARKDIKEFHGVLGTPLHPELKLASFTEDPEALGKELRKILKLSFEYQLDSKTDLFSFLRKSIEALNIYILKLPFPRADARGFSRFDADEPTIIVINSKSGKYERNFTLLHELGHILLRASGACIPRLDVRTGGPNLSIERWCNKFAAEFLLPKEEISREGMLIRSVKNENLEYIFGARRTYKTSGEALIFRMFDLGFIKFDEANR